MPGTTLTGPLRIVPAPDAAAYTPVALLVDDSDGTPANTLEALTVTLVGVDGTGNNAAPLAGVNAQLVTLRNAVASLARAINALSQRGLG
jgi:hypothetical protein